MPEIVIVKNQNEAADLVSDHIHDLMIYNPKTVLGLATGSTPMPLYTALAEKIKASKVDVSKVSGFALDEYVGISREHPQSYYQVIKNVAELLGLNPKNVHTPNGDYETIQTAAIQYEREIVEAGGVDLQILGIGRDGHIGFNEPGSSLSSITRIKTLTRETIEDNARFFNSQSEVPTHCITQGIATILSSRHAVLLAFGESKAQAIADTVEGGISSFVPASILQLHPHATIVIDEAAASKLKNIDYYKFAFDNKPEWQRI
jgi:glucosamine-6-phosphate deaminase